MALVISFVLQFTISQAGITAQTLTLMQGSKEKKNHNASQLHLILILAKRGQRELNPKP